MDDPSRLSIWSILQRALGLICQEGVEQAQVVPERVVLALVEQELAEQVPGQVVSVWVEREPVALALGELVLVV